MIPFDLTSAPLLGSNLIEAAAGTGKTFSIEGLFLRLLLERRLAVEEILVVTFTRAATAELRTRIHRRLLELRTALTRRTAPDDLARLLLAACGPEKACLRLVNQALTDFDKAAIVTIHGFCQRILHQHAFETGLPFENEFIPDQGPLLREIADDFWRRLVDQAPVEALTEALATLKGPEGLVRLLNAIRTPGFRLARPQGRATLSRLSSYRALRAQLQADWGGAREEVASALSDPALDGRSYGAIKAAGSRKSDRSRRVEALLESMDAFLLSPLPAFPPLPGLEQLSSRFIAAKTRRGRQPPRHPVFDLCQRLADEAAALSAEMEPYFRQIKLEAVEFAQTELFRRKQAQNVHSFDDLLAALHRALDGERGRWLSASVQRQFRAALVDEFQDTDALQYAIFARLFENTETPLFLIGDPKQAIYSFRGADIYSYLTAAGRAERRFTLSDNRRSAPGLVAAVNTVFSAVRDPFLIPEIGFVRARAARADLPLGSPPFVLWYLDSRRTRADGRPASLAEAEPWIARSLAAEVQRLTSAQPDPIRPADIAVLVRTNRQARRIKAELARAGVPAVVCSAGNIFDSPEADELQRLLLGIANPADTGRVKSAQATLIIGAAAHELIGGAAAGEARLGRFRLYEQIWQAEGFMPMFRQLLAGEQVKQRLLSLTEGERRLTNLLHLAEILHQAETEQHLGTRGLLQWLSAQRDPQTARSEEHQLRLESDADAVTIVTIHKSKGLEYRVVFCPYTWPASTVSAADYFYHDPADGLHLTLALNAAETDASRRQAEIEKLSENLRLLYVALTRARERCYFVWGRIRGTESSAPAYLFHFRDTTSDPSAGTEEGIVLRLQTEMKTRDDDDLLRDLAQLAARSGGSIEIRPLSAEPVSHRAAPEAAPPLMLGRRFTGPIDRSWKIASYSMLAAAAAHPDARDRDGTRPFLSAPVDEPDCVPPAAWSLAAFPRGSRAGSFFHAVLEQADFSRPDCPANSAMVAATLAVFGYEPQWLAAVNGMIAEVAAAALDPRIPGVSLAGVPPSQRRHEMEFYFPLKPITSGALEAVFSRFGCRLGAAAGSAQDETLTRLEFARVQGFMKGFIDLVFQHSGRYYLLDWKSNHLGDRPEHYQRERLAEVMHAELYTLQYHLYTLALHQYLQRRVPGYSYERDFGGVVYAFLRGVERGHGSGQGVFFDKPAPDFLKALQGELVARYAA